MSRVVIYTTEPCGFCRTAKTLLNSRKVPYEEVNLAKDPDGRAELAQKTGLMTFPQIVIDGETVGGFQELARLDGAGLLKALASAASDNGGTRTSPAPQPAT